MAQRGFVRLDTSRECPQLPDWGDSDGASVLRPFQLLFDVAGCSLESGSRSLHDIGMVALMFVIYHAVDVV